MVWYCALNRTAHMVRSLPWKAQLYRFSFIHRHVLVHVSRPCRFSNIIYYMYLFMTLFLTTFLIILSTKLHNYDYQAQGTYNQMRQPINRASTAITGWKRCTCTYMLYNSTISKYSEQCVPMKMTCSVCIWVQATGIRKPQY